MTCHDSMIELFVVSGVAVPVCVCSSLVAVCWLECQILLASLSVFYLLANVRGQVATLDHLTSSGANDVNTWTIDAIITSDQVSITLFLFATIVVVKLRTKCCSKCVDQSALVSTNAIADKHWTDIHCIAHTKIDLFI